MQVNPVTQANPNPGAPFIQGGPGSNQVGGQGPSTDAMAPTSSAPPATGQDPSAVASNAGGVSNTPAQTPQTAPIIIGNRIFNTKEEADNYVRNLEAKVFTPAPVQQAPQNNAQADLDPAEIVFDDPKAAFAALESKITRKLENQYTAAEAQKAAWTGFYEKNPDLKDHQDVVQSKLNQLNQNPFYRNKSWDQGLAELAQESRAWMARIRGTPNGGQQLPSKPAMVAGAGGGQLPSTPAPKPQTMNFIDEIRGMRKKA